MTFGSSSMEKLKQSLCHLRKYVFLFAVASYACTMCFLAVPKSCWFSRWIGITL